MRKSKIDKLMQVSEELYKCDKKCNKAVARRKRYYAAKTVSLSKYSINPNTRQSQLEKALMSSWFGTLENRANKWAKETIALWKTAIELDDAVDTGNLRDSIGLISQEVDKSLGLIDVTVGVTDKIKDRGPKRTTKDREWLETKKIYNADGTLRREKIVVRRRKGGYMKTLPGYDYSPYVLGSGGSHNAITDFVVGSKGGKKTGTGGAYSGNRINRLMEIAEDLFEKIFD